ncbi:MAG: hypothetical protein PWP04_956 [Candidatus Atribacteria bacterium]|nr:hypothetical protein [Candidatus Atribacteria bacterium]
MDFSSFLLIFSILLLSGVIAYIGDVFGRRIGKRKLSLFRLRPRYTAILVSILTGVLISAITLGFLSLASEDVRTALFGMRELREELEGLNQEVATKNYELAVMSKELAGYQEQIAALEERERALQASRISLEEQIKMLQENVQSLQSQRENLRQEVESLQLELNRLRASILAVRQGKIVFQDEEEILRVVAPGEMTAEEAEAYLWWIVIRAEEIAQARGAGTDRSSGRVILILEDNFNQAVELLENSSQEVVIRLVASVNTLEGEPVIGQFLVDSNRKIFSQGEEVYTKEVEIDSPQGVDLILGGLLRELNALGVQKGVLPQEGRIGVISATNLTAITEELKTMTGRVKIVARAEEDVFTSGPLRIRLEVSENHVPEGESEKGD